MNQRIVKARLYRSIAYLFAFFIFGYFAFVNLPISKASMNSAATMPGPASIVTNPGTTPQTVTVGDIFPTYLAVTVRDGADLPMAGLYVTFTAPSTGPSGQFTNSSTSITVQTDASGVAATTFNANSKAGGPYNVTAETAGLSPVTFVLTNVGGSPSHLVITAPANTVAGTPFNINVVALDQFNNLSVGYAGSLHFTSSDNSPANLPANTPLTNGQGTFVVTLFKAGPQTIAAYDASSSAVGGNSDSITVEASKASKIVVSAPVTAFRGIDFSFTVTALDGFNNVANGYPGSVHFSVTDPSAVMPGDSSISGGTKTFTTKLFTVGPQTITATDTYSSMAGTSGSINVVNINTGPRSRADFDGDGRTDVSVFRPSEGNWYLNRSTSGFMASHWGISTDLPVPGDYDGDGKADLAVWRPSSSDGVADFYVFNSADGTFSGYSWGVPGDVPMSGDYDGDGRVDIAIYRRSSNTWWIWNQRTEAVSSFTFGQPGDIPLVMDYDGDGRTDLAYYRPDDRSWYFAQAAGDPEHNFSVVQWGLQTDVLVPADYDGDKKDDIAVYRPTDGTWYILRSSDGQFMFVPFGISDDIAVPGDYDGDGKNDIAVYRPSTGTWFVNGSVSGFLALSFGTGSDVPIPASYHP